MTDPRALLQLAHPYCPPALQAEIEAALAVSKRATRLPDGWRPCPALMNWASAERPDLSITGQVEAFSDFWRAKAGKDATKLDWDATFRNWIRNCRTVYKPVPAPDRTPTPTQVAAKRKVEPTVSPAIQQLLGDFAAKMRINVGG